MVEHGIAIAFNSAGYIVKYNYECIFKWSK